MEPVAQTPSIALPAARYEAPSKIAQFCEQLIERVEAIPGVTAAAVCSNAPFDTNEWDSSFHITGTPADPPGREPVSAMSIVSPDYFSVMRIAILKGRAFSVRDDADAPAVAIVNRTFANRFFPNVDPVGARVRTYVEGTLSDSREIVGIVADVIDYVGQNQSVPQIYVPFFQDPVSTMTLVLRTSGDPSALTALVRNSIWEFDKDLPIENVKPMIEVLERKGAADRLICGLLGAFAGVALCLAAIGIYGLVSYLVVLRTSEIGLRMALGAQKGAILRLVITRGLMLAVMGCALGLVIAIPISRVLPIIRFESSWQGLLVLAIGPGLLIAASVLACCIPARRAMCIDPNVALRYE